MLYQNDLQAIATLIKNEVEPINKRLDNMENDISDLKSNVVKMDSRLDKIETRLDNIEEDIEVIKEDSQITREVTNDIGEWVDYYFHEDKLYPIDKEEIEKQKEIMRFAKQTGAGNPSFLL